MSDAKNTQQARAEQARRNRDLITRYYDLALNQKDFRAARAYIGPYYRQHSTYGADGPEGIGAFVEWAKVNLPGLHVDFVRIIADGDYVLMHNRGFERHDPGKYPHDERRCDEQLEIVVRVPACAVRALQDGCVEQAESDGAEMPDAVEEAQRFSHTQDQKDKQAQIPGELTGPAADEHQTAQQQRKQQVDIDPRLDRPAQPRCAQQAGDIDCNRDQRDEALNALENGQVHGGVPLLCGAKYSTSFCDGNYSRGVFMDALNLRSPSGWIPVAMSSAALAAVLVQLAVHGPARQADEGVTAHLWQLLMAGQLPVMAWFTAKWLRRTPRLAWPVLAIQFGAAMLAALPVALLGW